MSLWSKPSLNFFYPANLQYFWGMRLLGCFLFIWVWGTSSLKSQPENWVKRLETKDIPGGVESITPIADYQMVLITDGMGTIYIKTVPDLREVHRFSAHQGTVNMIYVAPDQKSILTAGDDGLIKWWSMPQGVLLESFKAKFNRVAFALPAGFPRGVVYGGYQSGRSTYGEGVHWMASGKDGKNPRSVWVQPSKYYRGVSYGITDGVFSENQKFILYGDGYAVFALHAENLQRTDSIPVRRVVNNLTQVNQFLYVWAEGLLCYYKVQPQSKLNAHFLGSVSVFPGHPDDASYSRIASSGGKWIATGNVLGDIFLLDAQTPVVRYTWNGHQGKIPALALWPQDSLLMTGGGDGKLVVWGPPIQPKSPPTQDSIPLAETLPKRVPNTSLPAVPELPPVSAPANPAMSAKPVIQVSALEVLPSKVMGRNAFVQKKISLSAGVWTLSIWDRQALDGDTVSIWLNHLPFLKEHGLTYTKQTFSLPLDPGNYFLVLHAHNLGSKPPNTAGLRLEMGDQSFELDLSSDLKRSATLQLTVVP